MSNDDFLQDIIQDLHLEVLPQLQESHVALAITDGELDPQFCLELGAMVMLDKPIIAIVLPGATIPEKLKMVADKIVIADPKTDSGREALQKALIEITEDHEESE